MEIDVTSMVAEPKVSSANIQLKEAIIATMLVCDWNVRAWTFLEAIRGRKNLWLLCKGNTMVNLWRLLWDVCSEGSIDVAILTGNSQHFFPTQPDPQDADACACCVKRRAEG